MAEELDDVVDPEDLEEDDLVMDADDADIADDELDDELEGLAEVELDDGIGDVDLADDAETQEDLADRAVTGKAGAIGPRAADEAEEEEEEEDEDEDVEASLDVILKERLVVEDEPEDDEATDAEDRSEANDRVLPKQPDEFVCRSCFLVKHPSQLADKKKMLCRDCV
jgi:hypothetical protein